MKFLIMKEEIKKVLVKSSKQDNFPLCFTHFISLTFQPNDFKTTPIPWHTNTARIKRHKQNKQKNKPF